jgi:two-component system, LytTR family, response regulator
MIRTLLVDDEQPARERLRALLHPFENLEVVGEAEDGVQAMEKIKDFCPDLIFLDIQMPGCTGLEVAQSLPSPRPAIIFCTAYDQYAVDAFELAAVDYLLKPVNRSRLAIAIRKIEAQHPSDHEDHLAKVNSALNRQNCRFLARKGTRYVVIPQSESICFISEEGLTRLYTAEQTCWVDPTLNDLENRLDPVLFFRISRAGLVRLDAIREVIPLIGGSGEVILSNGMKLEVSRRRFRDLLDQLKG